MEQVDGESVRGADWAGADELLVEVRAEGQRTRLSRREVWSAVRQSATALRERVHPGERVLLLLPSPLDFFVTFHACLQAGVVAVPIAPPDGRRPKRWLSRLTAIYQDSGAQAVLTSKHFAQLASQLPGLGTDTKLITVDELRSSPTPIFDGPPRPREPSDDIALLQYTSGSTGQPRGVKITFANIHANIKMCRDCFGIQEGTRIVSWLPMFHDMGLMSGVLLPFFVGAPVCLLPTLEFLQEPASWLRAISDFKGEVSGAPNFAYDLTLAKMKPAELEGVDLSSWRIAFNGAEPVRAGTLRRFTGTLAHLGMRESAAFPCYGLAEATLLVTGSRSGVGMVTRSFSEPQWRNGKAVLSSDRAEGVERASSGEVLGSGLPWNTTVRIVDADARRSLEDGLVGEIWLKGQSVAPGFWKEPTDENPFDAWLDDGQGPFLRTGDLGSIVEGQLYVAGRTKDVIIVHGRNHHPQDIEETVERSNDGLRPSCVVCCSMEHDGRERVVVLAEVRKRMLQSTDAALSAQLKSIAKSISDDVGVAHSVRVHNVVLMPQGEVRKTTSGKLQRRATLSAWLRGDLKVLHEEKAEIDAVGVGAAEVWTPQERRIASILGEVLGVESIGRRTHFLDLGGDSVSAVEFVSSVSEAFSVQLQVSDAFSNPTVERMSLLVSESRSSVGGESSSDTMTF